MCRYCECKNRRQKEQEAKIVEEETVKRIEEMVALRVAEELEKRKDEIETEVLRRVEEAKHIMEQEMLQELERRRKERLEEEKRREVHMFFCLSRSLFCRTASDRRRSPPPPKPFPDPFFSVQPWFILSRIQACNNMPLAAIGLGGLWEGGIRILLSQTAGM